MHSDDICVDATLLYVNPSLACEMLPGALMGGKPDLVEMCLERNPPIEKEQHFELLDAAARMWRLRCPLHSGNANPEDFHLCFGLLLEHGLDPNARNKGRDDAITILHWMAEITWHVAESDRIEFARLLLDHGADINSIGGERLSTPLGLAVRCEWHHLARYLLDRGADPNQCGATWASPLSWASNPAGHKEYRYLQLEPKVDVVKLLEVRGAGLSA
jgi:ankyrin repeat protein